MKKLFLFALALLSFGWSNASAAPRADEVKHDGYAVFVLDQTGWDAITLYMWGDVNDLNGAWPGMQVTGTENVKGIEYKYFDMGATNTGKSESLIFNNNNGGTKLKDFAYTINRDIYLAVTASGVREITHADSIPDPVLGNIELWPSYTTLLTEQPAEVKVLSMNNSLIHYETEWQDDMFNRMVVAEGKNALWTAHTNLGKSLQYHYDEGEGLTDAGTPSARMLVRTQAWTHIILQEQTAKPRTNFSGFRSSVKAWVEYIRTNCPNPNAVIILPVNWAYATDAAFTASNAEMLANYRAVAQEFGVVLCPVGVAYEQAYEKDATILQNWFKDDRHPKQNATYMACCLEYATIFGVSPATVSWAPATLTADEAAAMRTYAADTYNSFTQIVDQHNHSVHFEIRQLNAEGLSVETLASVCDTVLTAAGEHSVKVLYDGKQYTATVSVGAAKTEVITYPAIPFNEETMAYTQDFNTLGGAEVDPSTDAKTGIAKGSRLPEGWRIERNTTGPRQVGMYGTAADSTMYIGGQSLVKNAYNGTWNFGATGNIDRAVGGLTTGVANGTRSINVMAHLTNNGKTNYEGVELTYDIEKYRNGNNDKGFTVQLYYSTNGNTWQSAGDKFKTSYAPDTDTNGAAVVPMNTTNIHDTLDIVFTAGTDLYLAWNISVTSGNNCAGAPGYAIDNVSMTVLEAEIPEASYYIYADDQTGWESLALYAYVGTSSALYGNWPGIYPINTTEMEGVTYKVFPYDIPEAGSYNLIFNNGNNGLQTPDFTVTEARDYYLVVTADKVYEVGTAIGNTTAEQPASRKFIRNGIFYIEHAGHLYTAQGCPVNK